MYEFDKVIDRNGTTSIKWNRQNSFGVSNGLLPFWIADTDFATLPEITEAMRERCEHPIMGYADPKRAVYTAIQGWWERRYGWKPDTEWMLLSGGVVTAIYFSLDALVPKGEKVMLLTPVYTPFFGVIRNSEHTLVDCPLRYNGERYDIDFDLFERTLQTGVKAVILCNPHNPVGRVWTYEEMERIANLCAQYEVYLLSDEIHADFGLTRKYTSAGCFKQIRDRLVVFTAISKSFNMAGLNSSCMMIPNPAIKRAVFEAFDLRWISGPNELACSAIEAAYTHGDVWMDEQCAYLLGNAKMTAEFVAAEMPSVHVTEHEGTFLMWLDMRCMKMGSDALTAILAKEYGVALGNGKQYGAQADGFMRLNIGCPRSLLRQGLEQLSKLYRDYPHD